MSVKFSNNAVTTLTTGISVGATSFTVSSASLFPALAGGDWTYVTIGSEVIKITAISGTTFTCDATSASHSTGDNVELRMTAELLNDFAEDTEALPISGGALTGAVTTTSTFDGRDVGTDGTKLDNIEASADVTDTTNVVASLTAGTNVAISAGGTISSTDTNTTYSVGDNGLTQKNFTTTLKSKLDGIETSADVTDTTNVVASLTAGTNVTISAGGTISSTDNDTTYSVGDGGLTAKNFTTTLKTKLDGIATSANNYTHPTGAGNLHVPTAGTVGQVLTNTASGTGTWQDAASGTPEGTSILSTGETGGTKYLREDGDGTSSWQAVAGGGGASDIDGLTDGYNVGNSVGLGTNALLNDDGTTNFNTAVGTDALKANTSGSYNTASGSYSLTANNTGDYNVANGYKALLANTTGSENTATGMYALSSHTTASRNTATGFRALQSSTANNNTATGYYALKANTTGYNNTASGYAAMLNNTTGTYNTALGSDALQGSTTSKLTGSYNTGVGYQTGLNLSTGQYNVLNGYQAGYGLTAGSYNLCLGWQAGDSITSANYNICLGGKAGAGVVAGANNVLVGHESAKTYNFSNVTAVGFQAGELNQGSDNVFVGYKAGRSETASNKLHIANNSTESLIEGDFSAKTVNINGALTVNGAAVGGAMEFVSKTTLSAAATVEYTGLTAGATYFLTISDLIRSSTAAFFQSQFLDGNDAALTALNYGSKIIHNGTASLTKNQNDRMWNMYSSYANNSVFGYAYITISSNGDRGSFNTSHIRTNFNGTDHGYGTESAQSGCYAAFATPPTGGISGLKLFPSTGTFTSGILTLYKVKDS